MALRAEKCEKTERIGSDSHGGWIDMHEGPLAARPHTAQFYDVTRIAASPWRSTLPLHTWKDRIRPAQPTRPALLENAFLS